MNEIIVIFIQYRYDERVVLIPGIIVHPINCFSATKSIEDCYIRTDHEEHGRFRFSVFQGYSLDRNFRLHSIILALLLTNGAHSCHCTFVTHRTLWTVKSLTLNRL